RLRLPHADRRRWRPRPQRHVLHAHDPRLGRAGAELDDGPHRRRRPRHPRVDEVVAGRRPRTLLTSASGCSLTPASDNGEEPAVRTYDIVSADAHILEPTDIWETWLPKQHQDKAPK